MRIKLPRSSRPIWQGNYLFRHRFGFDISCAEATKGEIFEMDMEDSYTRFRTGKPTVYIASAYTQGDVAANTHFQCKVFDQLLDEGKVLPVAPLWSHFQHTIYPRKYGDWIAYDQALLPMYDVCLRLSVDMPQLNYQQPDSTGADGEVDTFIKLGKPVFHSIEELYKWLDGLDKGLCDE